MAAALPRRACPPLFYDQDGCLTDEAFALLDATEITHFETTETGLLLHSTLPEPEFWRAVAASAFASKDECTIQYAAATRPVARLVFH